MSVRPPGPTSRSVDDLFVFEAARALAALAVLLAHARSFVIRDAAEEPALSLPARVFFASTGLGHQAVMVFFVISGALVTRSVLMLRQQGELTFRRFATARVTRLWVVLLPCLAIGGLVDRTGLAISDHAPSTYGVLRPALPSLPLALDISTVLGNLAFLQTIVVPVFGSNGPLWSLANEAWYYVAAFLVVASVTRQPHGRQATFWLALCLLAACLATTGLWLYLPVWLLGAALAPTLMRPADAPRPRGRVIALLIFVGVLAAARTNEARWLLAGDYALAGATAAVIFFHAHARVRPSFPAHVLRGIARGSYSLYLSHLPLLAFFSAVVFDGRRLPLGLEGLVRLGGVLVLALAWGWAFWWSFERHTPAVRAWVDRAVLRACGAGWGREEATREVAS